MLVALVSAGLMALVCAMVGAMGEVFDGAGQAARMVMVRNESDQAFTHKFADREYTVPARGELLVPYEIGRHLKKHASRSERKLDLSLTDVQAKYTVAEQPAHQCTYPGCTYSTSDLGTYVAHAAEHYAAIAAGGSADASGGGQAEGGEEKKPAEVDPELLTLVRACADYTPEEMKRNLRREDLEKVAVHLGYNSVAADTKDTLIAAILERR